MRRRIGIGALAVGLAAAASGAVGQGGSLAGCADPDLAPTTTLKLCRDALQDPGLGPRRRAAVLVNLGVAQAELGRHGDAVRSFTLAIETDDRFIQAYTNRARSHAAEGRTDAALEDFDRAIVEDPSVAEAWLGRGALLLGRGAAAAAVSDLSRAIALEDELTAAFFNRGIGYLILGDGRAADEDFSTVIARDGTDAGAFVNRGRARALAGLPGAEADFDRAIGLDPDWPRAWSARGMFHDRAGRTEAADADFLRAYELGMQDRWLVERVQRIGRR
ncbi:MAG: tetratricopeptide repeat protein [Paracoccaceae bacterium]